MTLHAVYFHSQLGAAPTCARSTLMPRITLGSLVSSSTIKAVIVARDSRLSRRPITFAQATCAVGRAANASSSVGGRGGVGFTWASEVVSRRQQIVITAADLIRASIHM